MVCVKTNFFSLELKTPSKLQWCHHVAKCNLLKPDILCSISKSHIKKILNLKARFNEWDSVISKSLLCAFGSFMTSCLILKSSLNSFTKCLPPHSFNIYWTLNPRNTGIHRTNIVSAFTVLRVSQLFHQICWFIAQLKKIFLKLQNPAP